MTSISAKAQIEKKAKRQKQFVAVGSLVLLALLGFELPKMLGGSSDTGAPVVAPTTPGLSSPLAAAGALPDTDRPVVQHDSGQLLSFGLFKSKDPFVQQISTQPALGASPATPTPSAPAPVPAATTTAPQIQTTPPVSTIPNAAVPQVTTTAPALTVPLPSTTSVAPVTPAPVSPPPVTSTVALTPSTPVPTTPAVTAPAPIAPAVTAPAPIAPAVTTPVPTTPAVTMPAPIAPAPTTPAPTTPAPTTPAVTTPPIAPAVTTPAPIAPAPTTPAVTVPVPTTPAATTPAVPAPTSVAIATNGACQTVAVDGTFPASEDIFRVVSIAKDGKSAKIAVVGGAYDSGQASATVTLGEKLTLVNTADGTRYVIELQTECSVASQPVTTTVPTSTVTPPAPVETPTTPIVTDSLDTTTPTGG